MKLINKYDIPDPIFRAAQSDPYSKGDSDFSATGLAVPPRAAALIEKHNNELEIDVLSRIDSMIGSGLHLIIERGERHGIDLVERRFFYDFTVDGKSYIVSAQIDFFESDTRTLWDWKTTKAWAFHKKNGAKAEWTAQMNVGRLLMYENGYEVSQLLVCGILKDWSKKDAEADPGYPQIKVMTKPIALWPHEKTRAYIEGKIRALIRAKEELPECTFADTWGGRRCADWCDASSVCDQYKNALKTGLLTKRSDK
jgi:hypothetical protein